MNNSFKGKNGPLLIAEIGGNHEGNFEYAKKLTQLAIESGADYVKFQIYKGDTLVSKLESPDRNNHFKKFELSEEQHIKLAKMVTNAGVKYMASVWDPESIDWIDDYIQIYKIGSGDLTAYPVLKKTTERNKPMIISTGLSSEEDVVKSINYIQSVNPRYKEKDMIGVLQCTSMYPIPLSDSNLSVMDRFRNLTNLTVGYSDHTEGILALKYAYAMGAEILEFHFTDDREGKTFRDHKVSLTKTDVHDLISEIKLINILRGNEVKSPCEIEIENHHDITFRRAVYPSINIKAGEKINHNNLTTLRPNHGIDARLYDDLIGKTALIDLEAHQKLDWKYFN
ncbi:N-acetylneuraminate synthase family protein [Aequorivita viscosa]|nr:N-acetylneuraminate synthase family protein [Aequorivita viscosa]